MNQTTREANTDDLVKVSVFLPEHVHRRLKLDSVERRTSLQKVVAAELTRVASTESNAMPKAEQIEALEFVAGRHQESVPPPQVIKKWQNRLKKILVSRNRLAILNCTTSIEAMEAFLDERSVMGAGLQPPVPEVEAHSSD